MNTSENIDLVLLNRRKLREFINYIDKVLLTYRSSLDLSEDITFGVEIEYEGNIKTNVDDYISKHYPRWLSRDDASLDSGGEIVSPILEDSLNCWHELKGVCKYLTRIKVCTNGHAGGHVHLGANALGEDIESWKIFLKLYMVYENVLFRFGAGDKQYVRNGIYKYAPAMGWELYYQIDEINKLNSVYQLPNVLNLFNKYHAMNFLNVDSSDISTCKYKNTIEFRFPNATTNYIIWQNNINLFAKMALTCRNKLCDVDFIDYKIKHEFISFIKDKYLYYNISLRNALEFADLIFDNKLDKLYFLRQYLKNYECIIDPKEDNTPYTKKFTK